MIEFHIVDGSDQIEAKSKAFTTISIAFTQNTKDLQLANDVLDQNALCDKARLLTFCSLLNGCS